MSKGNQLADGATATDDAVLSAILTRSTPKGGTEDETETGEDETETGEDETETGEDETETGEDETGEDETGEDETGEDETGEDETGEDEGTEDNSESADGKDAADVLDVSDDDLIEVKIDGKIETRTLGELKQAVAFEGAAAGRLKDATLIRNKAEDDQRKAMAELTARQEQFDSFVQQLDGLILQPTVPAPDESLRATDPTGYLAQVDAYNADMQRVNNSRVEIATKLQEQQRKREEDFAAFQAREAELLAQKLPILIDEKEGPKAQKHLLEAAKFYGITPEEMAKIGDHRLFLIAYDGYKYQQLLKQAKTKGDDMTKAKNPRPARKLRTGVAKTKLARSAAQKSRKKAVERAAKSGSVEDVLATILKPAN